MRDRLRSLLIEISGNRPAQVLLERGVLLAHALMGIGAGGDVTSSGEKILVERLRRRQAATGGRLSVFDVGANQGQFLRLMREGLAGVPAAFHAFEPSRHAYEVLAEAMRGVSDVRVHNLALGARAETVELHHNHAGSPLASLSKRRLDHFGIDFNLAETVTVETLDAHCARHDVRAIDLLKLDVEGHELAVLQGAQDTFRAGKVWALTFEFGGGNIDSRTYFQDFWYLLKAYGMRSIFRITPSGYLARLPRYSETYEQFRTTNFLAFRDDV